jgi:hypothetical protein
MHALNQTEKVTHDPEFILWAIELAKTAHKSFTYLPSPDGQEKTYWKMSIDLKTPLVPSMGQHDPLDGYIIYNELHNTEVMDFSSFPLPDLTTEILDMKEICHGLQWATADPLGIGGLLSDAFRIAQLISRGHGDLFTLLGSVLNDALLGLDYYTRGNSLNLPCEYRLAFRELGLSIGLRGVERLLKFTQENSRIIDPEPPLKMQLESLMKYVPLAGKIEEFWLKYENQRSTKWTEHQNTNMVMLATSLIPDGVLRI